LSPVLARGSVSGAGDSERERAGGREREIERRTHPSYILPTCLNIPPPPLRGGRCDEGADSLVGVLEATEP